MAFKIDVSELFEREWMGLCRVDMRQEKSLREETGTGEGARCGGIHERACGGLTLGDAI